MCTENPAAGPFVLFADDDEDVLKLLGTASALYGIRADFARSPDEILERVNQHCSDESDQLCYDVLVLDVHYKRQKSCQRKTGILALSKIRKKYRDLPVLVLTGFPLPLTRENVMGLDAEVVQKPVDVESLMERILYLAHFGKDAVRAPGDRRKASMNRTHHRRRATDRPLEFPKALQNVLAQVAANEKH